MDEVCLLIKAGVLELKTVFNAAGVTMVGAISQYLYQIQTGKRSFEMSRFLITCVLGLYMGMLVGKFLPPEMEYRDGWLSLAGFSMYQVYAVLDAKAGVVLSKWFRHDK